MIDSFVGIQLKCPTQQSYKNFLFGSIFISKCCEILKLKIKDELLFYTSMPTCTSFFNIFFAVASIASAS